MSQRRFVYTPPLVSKPTYLNNPPPGYPNTRLTDQLGPARGYARGVLRVAPPNSPSAVDSAVNTAQGVVGALATGSSLYNPYVAGGLAVAGAALTAYQVGKALYKAIF